ncbi:FtsK/SpoIIIE domain-containing protein [Enterococcus faecalis]|uniref:FtsK/SpoIIIE domain-containing protein n=1 Tax=Enterococcus TaxID=1350 RepID=UPI0001B2E1C3|nr:FtsK/SpoIIIE domain-containing protein [Enterococcus faecalis]HAQ6842027.1 DUF87 domain-containing protein [Enterococcus faecium]EEU75723.1 conjugative transposon FtsK/SpoIIIE-family protein [Enterococcus faecalis E1Sol]MDK8197747.1 FtsK/SpoIIIE domain-containing protein [Enterococcus faecalis]MDU7772742.1 FtsK/SpoIIIE domain-containing protein [Enterococcus faecalis]MEB8145860.1 FtsK/SpoIIIE domain-containing protein [Enterococcus faecalis]
MRFLSKKGSRIRPSDKNLVFFSFFFFISTSFTCFFLPFHIKFLTQSNWDFNKIKSHFISLYGFITFIFSISGILLLLYIFHRNYLDVYKRIVHRQKISKMILENGWYEVRTIPHLSLFEDSKSKKENEIIKYPKIYYRLSNGIVYVLVEITMGKYQEQLLHLEDKLESGLYCELISKELKDSFVEYALLYDTIGNRITIDEVIIKDGSMKLMKNIYWNFDSLPHMLIAGGTGGGKTYFILTIIEALLRTKAKLFILDPKNADLADLGTVMENVYYKKEDISECIDDFYNRMINRSLEMKKMSNYKTGENYAYLKLEPNFLIFDEYVAFMEMLNNKDSLVIMNKLKQIVMLGRQAGFFIILACQRPDAKYLQDGIRDQFNFRVALGRMSELGFSMMFGDVDKRFFLKQIKGRGYVDVGTNVISEFYTPLVPKNHDFLDTINQLYHTRISNNSNESGIS